MTEKTAPLSLQQLKDVRELCLPGTAWRSVIDELITSRDQLEAERQRSDNLKKPDPLVGLLRSQLKNAKEELAALKGDQVPVGIIECGLSSSIEGEFVYVMRSKQLIAYGEPIFTAPQKPVVLLPKFTDRHTCMNAGCDAAAAYKEDVMVMNKAAGGIVKEGE